MLLDVAVVVSFYDVVFSSKEIKRRKGGRKEQKSERASESKLNDGDRVNGPLLMKEGVEWLITTDSKLCENLFWRNRKLDK